MRRAQPFSTAVSDRLRLIFSIAVALSIYGAALSAALCLPDPETAEIRLAAEIRLPNLAADVDSSVQSVLPAETADRLPETDTKAVRPTESEKTAAEQFVPAESSTAEKNSDAEPSALPNVDFVKASAGVELPMPAYPAAARRRGLGGTVTVELTVGSDGCVVSAEILQSSHEWFRRAVLPVVERWHFPPREGGFVTRKKFVFKTGEIL